MSSYNLPSDWTLSGLAVTEENPRIIREEIIERVQPYNIIYSDTSNEIIIEPYGTTSEPIVVNNPTPLNNIEAYFFPIMTIVPEPISFGSKLIIGDKEYLYTGEGCHGWTLQEKQPISQAQQEEYKRFKDLDK
jgi:hypothetical protein